MFDDLDLPKKTKSEFPRNLETMSIEEIQNYIDELKEEIQRAEKDIERKSASRNAADSVFKL